MSSPAYHGEMYGVKNYCEPYITEEQAQRIKEVSSQKSWVDCKRRIYIFSGLMTLPDFAVTDFLGARWPRKKRGIKCINALDSAATKAQNIHAI